MANRVSIKGKLKASIGKKSVKAGVTPRPHGGFPTQKVIAIRTNILTSLKEKK